LDEYYINEIYGSVKRFNQLVNGDDLKNGEPPLPVFLSEIRPNNIIKTYGTVSILVNNAGITRDRTIKKMTPSDWQEVIDTNLGSVFNMTKACWEEMTVRKFGRIINISSVNGQAGQYGQINYCAAKAGIVGMTKAIALEGARYNITANTVAPGYVDTEMVASVPENVLEKIVNTIPVGRLGHPIEIARAVSFLAREDTQFVTGSTISINGGHHMY
jgi:acetoacetyl-CoA reductase